MNVPYLLIKQGLNSTLLDMLSNWICLELSGLTHPFCFPTGHLTARSDVYSFGVVLLEILTGKRSVDKSRPSGEHNLVEWARPYFSEKKKVFRLIDPRLSHYSEKGSFKAAQLAFQCLSRDPRVRPTMQDVVETLGQIQNLKDITDNPHYQPTSDSRSSRSSRSWLIRSLFVL